MPRIALADKLAALQHRRQELDNQVRLLEARKKEQARKDDARRKIIVGALALEHYAKNPQSEFARQLLRLLKEYVPARNQALFADLPEMGKAEGGQAPQH